MLGNLWGFLELFEISKVHRSVLFCFQLLCCLTTALLHYCFHAADALPLFPHWQKHVRSEPGLTQIQTWAQAWCTTCKGLNSNPTYQWFIALSITWWFEYGADRTVDQENLGKYRKSTIYIGWNEAASMRLIHIELLWLMCMLICLYVLASVDLCLWHTPDNLYISVSDNVLCATWSWSSSMLSTENGFARIFTSQIETCHAKEDMLMVVNTTLANSTCI